MTRMPKSVKVGPHTYRVVLKPAAAMRDGKQKLDGWCRYSQLEIWVRRGLPLSMRQETLLHEILHAATYPELADKAMEEEDFIMGITTPLLNLLQENPKLLSFLLEKEKKK